MTREDKKDNLLLSLVIPVYNEEKNIRPLWEKISGVMKTLSPYRDSFEAVFVNDGSVDNTQLELDALHEEFPCVKALQLLGNFKKAAAYSAGFKYARGKWIITMDGDLQDDPDDIPLFLEKLEEGYDYVSGWKYQGKGNPYRSLPSRFFNLIVRNLMGVKLHDVNCPFKAFRSDVIRTIDIYGEQYRFIPVKLYGMGFRITEVKVNNLPRFYGRSKYGMERFLRGFFDLITIFFLEKYLKRPLHFFGLIGLFFSLIGGATVILLYIVKFIAGIPIHERPYLFLMGLLMTILGIQFISIGLLGELFTYHAKRDQDHYVVKKFLD
ncbi:glycosyltransferase family 2 protein [Candidatus Sumerlaeota bacterium]|nr:glycosyltransferase family 2 protein [Candidatus Sumerlaeota bacterium]